MSISRTFREHKMQYGAAIGAGLAQGSMNTCRCGSTAASSRLGQVTIAALTMPYFQ
jgi:hypothetical protein